MKIIETNQSNTRIILWLNINIFFLFAAIKCITGMALAIRCVTDPVPAGRLELPLAELLP